MNITVDATVILDSDPNQLSVDVLGQWRTGSEPARLTLRVAGEIGDSGVVVHATHDAMLAWAQLITDAVWLTRDKHSDGPNCVGCQARPAQMHDDLCPIYTARLREEFRKRLDSNDMTESQLMEAWRHRATERVVRDEPF